MTTPPIKLAATVERVEIPTVEEIHEATSRIIADPLLHKVVDWIGVSMREVGRLYSPAPSPAETGAVPVDLIRKAAMALENVGKYGVASDLYAWLATQRVTR